MDEKYTPQKGDRVRVVLEGEVHWTSPSDAAFDMGGDQGLNTIVPDRSHVVSIERIEPPVEAFGPGDTVRDAHARDCIFTIGRNGYFDHLNNILECREYEFTSKDYERVTLAEVPF